ncbi:MAG: hypothetical protein ABI383_06835 [Acidobacteriaceae bacterium]
MKKCLAILSTVALACSMSIAQTSSGADANPQNTPANPNSSSMSGQRGTSNATNADQTTDQMGKKKKHHHHKKNKNGNMKSGNSMDNGTATPPATTSNPK